ncbi:hypothetical protein L0152_04725, partial [bacterium]|nr:hypothetical protein [bacterium]
MAVLNFKSLVACAFDDKREFIVAGVTFFFVPVCFFLDIDAEMVFQNAMGVGAWMCLLILL